MDRITDENALLALEEEGIVSPLVDKVTYAYYREELRSLPSLSDGCHDDLTDGCCAVEAVSVLRNEPFGDHPSGCQFVYAVVRSWNDHIGAPEFGGDQIRDMYIRPFVPLLALISEPSEEVVFRRVFAYLNWITEDVIPFVLDTEFEEDQTTISKTRELLESISIRPRVNSWEDVETISTSIILESENEIYSALARDYEFAFILKDQILTGNEDRVDSIMQDMIVNSNVTSMLFSDTFIPSMQIEVNQMMQKLVLKLIVIR